MAAPPPPGDPSPPRRLSPRAALLAGLVLALVAAASAWLTRDSWGRAPAATTATQTPFAAQPPTTDAPLLWRTTDWTLTEVRLEALDWTGHAVGTLSHPCLAPCTMFASPDGRRILLALRGEPSQAEAIDATGATVGSLPDVVGMSWASDSRHLCGVRAQGGTTLDPTAIARVELDLADPTAGARRAVTTIAWKSSAPTTSFSYVQAFCYSDPGRAVVVLLEGQTGMRALRVVDLTDGHEVYGRDDAPPGRECGCPVDSIAVSGGGRLLAENLAAGGVRMRDTATGAVVPSPLPATGVIEALSWNARLAIVSNGVTTSGAVDLVSGATVWTAPPLTRATVRATRPGGDDLLLDLQSTTSSTTPDTQLILHPDGTIDHLPPGEQI